MLIFHIFINLLKLVLLSHLGNSNWKSVDESHKTWCKQFWKGNIVASFNWKLKKNLLTNSMEQSLSRKANSHSASKEIPWLLWNLKVHCRVHKGPPILRPCMKFHNKLVFCGEELLAPHPTPKLENYSALHDCLFNIFTASFHIWRPSPLSTTRGHTIT
jgi:hypothetical protein